jgi:hypothetical protein
VRKPRNQTFTKTDFYRAVDAARARDLPIAAVEATRTPDGVRTVKVIVGEPAKGGAAPEAELTPLEEWRAKRSGQG